MKKMVDHLESKTIKSLTCEKIIHEASDSFYWNKSMISIQKEELGRELFCVKL
jgi:heme oxygenase